MPRCVEKHHVGILEVGVRIYCLNMRWGLWGWFCDEFKEFFRFVRNFLSRMKVKYLKESRSKGCLLV